MKLYGYFRSSAAYRVRIALGLKGLDYEYVAVHLPKGEQRAEHYLVLNPQALVPTLVDEEKSFTQSLAIIEYLDERYPQPPASVDTARAGPGSCHRAVHCVRYPSP